MFHLGFADQTEPESAVDPALAAAAAEDEHESIGHEVSSVLSDLLPWGVSIMLHAGVLLLSVFLFWTVQQTKLNAGAEDEDNRNIIPDALLSARPGTGMSLTSHANPAAKDPRASGGSQRHLSQTDTKTPWASSSGTGGAKGTLGLIGTGGGGGTGTGGGGKTNIWGGVGTGEGVFSGASVGSGGNAYRIVYIIDASGSLIEGMPFVLNELQKSIHELVDKQTFDVFFAQDDQVLEVPTPNNGWKKASKENQDKVIDWLDPRKGNVVPSGKTNPMKALVAALRLSPAPQLIFILSDNFTGQGQWERSQEDLIAEMKKANTSNTKINTIQFLQPDPLLRYGKKGTLERISNETGGIYRYIDAKTLGIE